MLHGVSVVVSLAGEASSERHQQRPLAICHRRTEALHVPLGIDKRSNSGDVLTAAVTERSDQHPLRTCEARTKVRQRKPVLRQWAPQGVAAFGVRTELAAEVWIRGIQRNRLVLRLCLGQGLCEFRRVRRTTGPKDELIIDHSNTSSFLFAHGGITNSVISPYVAGV